MGKWTLPIAIAALAALVGVGACSNSSSKQSNQTTSSTPSTTTTSGAQPHNQADVTFAQQMIPHHQQAIQMSDIVLAKQGIDPRVVDLANQIKAAQGPEIQQMQGWLSQWGPSTPSMSSNSMMPSSSMMPSGGMTPSGSMPGMVSDQEITSLHNSDGVEASRMFLTMMIHHHEGAITMAQNETNQGQNPPAIAMARSIISSQQQQSDTMKNLLATM